MGARQRRQRRQRRKISIRRFLYLPVLLALLALLLCGCSSDALLQSSAAEDIKVYALVTKGEGNPYNELMAEGFSEVIEEKGGNCLISDPEDTSAEAQIEIIEDLAAKGVDSITVAANDADALTEVLTSAMDQGIHVSAVDSDVSADARELFINQADAADVAESLADAVYECCGGSGQWAILSASALATNQNAWIDALRAVLEDEKYADLRLVDIVYGNDDEELSAECAKELLEEYPDLKVICAPTVVGLSAAAQAVTEAESTVKVTGLGLPSEMEAYVLGTDAVCPCLYLWNPIELGQAAAYASAALVEGTVSGTAGEILSAGSLGGFRVEEDENGATQIIVNSLVRFDETNIAEWAALF